MATKVLHFPQPARRVYTAVKHVVHNTPGMKRVKCDDQRFIVSASHGWSLIPLGENVKTGLWQTEQKNRMSMLNQREKSSSTRLENKANIQELSDYIKNRVGKLCSDEEIKLNH